MSIGYACLILGVPGTQIKSCRLKNAGDHKLAELIKSNLQALKNMLEYNQNNGIRLFRISSDIIPLASHPVNILDWQEVFKLELAELGSLVTNSGMRVSMHPGQYTVLNSIRPDVVQKSIDDLVYHAVFLDSLGVDAANKIILHTGGVYGDKKQSLQRFAAHFAYLPENVRRRLCIENDDRHFNIGDVMDLGCMLSLPVVFDTLHHSVNNCGAGPDLYGWIAETKKTWKHEDGKQKIHYSQQDGQKGRGAHSATIKIRKFIEFYERLDDKEIDIMLEVKDKNLSACKCSICVSKDSKITKLEKEWAKYKYLVLEKNPSAYQAIRELLKNKTENQAIAFYEMIEQSMDNPSVKENVQNAALHVWGYFKKTAAEKEKEHFFDLLSRFMLGKTPAQSVKNYLYRLAIQYTIHYLLAAYYFLKIVE